MTTAVMNLPMLLERARVQKTDLSVLKGMLDGRLHLSKNQRREIDNKIHLREMDGHVFHFQALFDQKEAWRKNYQEKPRNGNWYPTEKEVEALSCEAEVPTIGFACVKDEQARYDCRMNAFRAGDHFFYTGRAADGRTYTDLLSRVPYIPSNVMPKWGTRSEHFVVFDVPKWTGVPNTEDPYIVKQIDSDHFKVVAHWDLSDNEKSLMKFAASR